MKPFKLACLLILTTLSPMSSADVYTDRLSECFLFSSTDDDKLNLVKWMFTAMSLHPAVQEIVEVSPTALGSL